MRPLIKICGITNSEDANKCVELGADFLGFIFAESPRTISAETAEQIISEIPESIRTVALFKNNSIGFIESIIEKIPFSMVQLHGDENMYYITRLNRPVIKSFDMTDKQLLSKISAYNGMGIIPLLDLPKESQSSIPIDVAKEISLLQPIMLAGKINVFNIKKIINTIQPWCIDICSGVEKEPGKKDHALLEELFNLLSNNMHRCRP